MRIRNTYATSFIVFNLVMTIIARFVLWARGIQQDLIESEYSFRSWQGVNSLSMDQIDSSQVSEEDLVQVSLALSAQEALVFRKNESTYSCFAQTAH
jgi:hypothetical protein